MTVYQATARIVPPRNLNVSGCSAGGALTLEMMLRARAEPADVGCHRPRNATNALVDNVLASPRRVLRRRDEGHKWKDPLLSHVYGDLNGFPPKTMTSWTCDLMLSNTVRVNQELPLAGVETRLKVFEAQSHAQFYRDGRVSKVEEANGEIAAFVGQYLGTLQA